MALLLRFLKKLRKVSNEDGGLQVMMTRAHMTFGQVD
jgi:hypothetical protein